MKNFLFYSALVLILAACGETIEGDGNITVKNRGQFDFKSIEISDLDRAIIQPDNSNNPKPVTVETDANLQEYILVEKEGDVLKISIKKGYKLKSKKMVVQLQSGINLNLSNNGHTDISIEPHENIDLNYSGNGSGDLSCSTVIHTANISQNGSGNCIFESEIQSDLEASINGSGNMTFKDKVMNSAIIELSGSGNYVFESKVSNMDINKSGSGDVWALNAEADEVSIQSSGSGNTEVFVTGSLKVSMNGSGDVSYKGNPSIKKSINGSGRLIKLDD